jgi:hypothetical protein
MYIVNPELFKGKRKRNNDFGLELEPKPEPIVEVKSKRKTNKQHDSDDEDEDDDDEGDEKKAETKRPARKYRDPHIEYDENFDFNIATKDDIDEQDEYIVHITRSIPRDRYQCRKCKKFPRDNQPHSRGQKCEYKKCDGKIYKFQEYLHYKNIPLIYAKHYSDLLNEIDFMRCRSSKRYYRCTLCEFDTIVLNVFLNAPTTERHLKFRAPRKPRKSKMAKSST